MEQAEFTAGSLAEALGARNREVAEAVTERPNPGDRAGPGFPQGFLDASRVGR